MACSRSAFPSGKPSSRATTSASGRSCESCFSPSIAVATPRADTPAASNALRRASRDSGSGSTINAFMRLSPDCRFYHLRDNATGTPRTQRERREVKSEGRSGSNFRLYFIRSRRVRAPVPVAFLSTSERSVFDADAERLPYLIDPALDTLGHHDRVGPGSLEPLFLP